MIDANWFFEACESVNVLIVGDVMTDRYLSGKVKRISPEAPVPVLELETEENRPGGAANVALNIQAMGANAFLCGVIGKDENAGQFLHLLDQQGLSTQGIVQSGERQTTVKTRILASNQHLLRVDREDTYPLSSLETTIFLSQVFQVLNDQKIQVILFQDYNKGVLTPEVIKAIIEAASERNIPTVVDPKKDHFFNYKNVSLFKPNLKEIREALPFAVDSSLFALKKAADYLFEKLDVQQVLITLSEKGIFCSDSKLFEIIPTQARNIADVCGAGDTVISIAALGTALGLELSDISSLANLAGGQVCEKVGVVPVDKNQLKEEYLRFILDSKT